MHRFIITCFLLLYTCCASAQKNITLSGTIQENGQSAPVTLILNFYKDTTTGVCKTIFPLNIKNSEKIGSGPGSGLRDYELGVLTLVLGDFRYRRITTPLTGYEITDGFRLDLMKRNGAWTGQFFDMKNGRPARRGLIYFTEKADAPPPAVKKQQRPVIKNTSIKTNAAKRDTATIPLPVLQTQKSQVDSFSKYEPLYRFSKENISFSVLDAFKEDGDVISWRLDGGEQKEITITNAPQQFTLPLSAGKVHTLTITLLKEGNERGNTPTIDLTDGSAKVHRDLSGDFGKTYNLYLLYNP